MKVRNLLMVLIMVVLVFGFSGCKKSVKKFDIVGSWSVTWNMLDDQIQSTFIFNGSKESGTITCNSYSGTYTVNNSSVKIELIISIYYKTNN
jgi:hypothetical protein